MTKVKFPDFGQAMCGIAFGTENNALIFDSGDKDNFKKLKEELLDNGVKECYFDISHLDDDHVRGLIEILKTYDGIPEIKEIIMPNAEEYNSDNYFLIKRLIYQQEAILATKDILKCDSEQLKEFSNDIKKNSFTFDSEIYRKFEPKNDKERIILKYLVYRQNDKPFNHIIKELEYYYSDKIKMYEDIAKYAENICEKENIPFKEIDVKTISAGETYKKEYLGIGELEIIKPEIEWSYNENKNSTVSFLTTERQRLCFPGDIEKSGEEWVVNFIKDKDYKCVFLISPHHGSKTSSSKIFITTLDPDVILFQAREGVYKHPSEETVVNYNRWGRFFIKQESAGDIELLIENGFTYLKAERITKILEGKGVIKTNIKDYCDQELSKIEEVQYLKFKENKDFEKYVMFREGNYYDKVVMIENSEERSLYKNILYLKESAEEILEKGIDIQDSSFLQMFFVGGEVKVFEQLKEVLDIVCEYDKDDPYISR